MVIDPSEVRGTVAELPVYPGYRKSDDNSARFGEKCGRSGGRDKELVADAAKETFDFSLGGGVANGGMPQEAADAGTEEGDLLTAINRAVIDEELLGDAAFVEGGADGLDEGIDVFLEEELAVARTRLASSRKAMAWPVCASRRHTGST